MRKFLLFTLFILYFFSGPDFFMAHSGNTDSFGGHTCRTNCEDWGLDYGEYHYHNDSRSDTSNDQADYDEGYKKGYDDAYGYTSECIEDYEWSWEGPQAFGDGYEDGINDGHQDGLEICEENSQEEVQGNESNSSSNETEITPTKQFTTGVPPEVIRIDEEVSSSIDNVGTKKNEVVPKEVIYFVIALSIIIITPVWYQFYKLNKKDE